jgi:hypothetical protein
MLVAGCSMLVEDPVFSGDKEKSLPYSIQAKDGISAPLQQVSRNQYPVSRVKLLESCVLIET